MWWQKREYEAGCWVFSHPQKIPFFSTPYEGSSLRIPNYYWPRRKMMMSLHSSSFVSTLNGYHHAIVRVKSTKNHHWDSICGPQRLCSISGPTTSTDALKRNSSPAFRDFLASIGLVNSIFCTTASMLELWKFQWWSSKTFRAPILKVSRGMHDGVYGRHNALFGDHPLS